MHYLLSPERHAYATSERPRPRFVVSLLLSCTVHAVLLLRAGAVPNAFRQHADAHPRAIQVSLLVQRTAHPFSPSKSRPTQHPHPQKLRKQILRHIPTRTHTAASSSPKPHEPGPSSSSDPAPSESTAVASSIATHQGVSEDERERYLARLLAHIARFKRYPRVACRRGIEGDVRLVFIPTPTGDARDPHAFGPTLLRRAALNALRRAQPLPPPPRGWGEEVVELTMRFRLR